MFQPAKPPILGPGAENNHTRPYQSSNTSYYVGWTVVHVNFVVLAAFYPALFVPWFTGWLAAVPVVAACPLMVSGYRSYKTHVSHALAGLLVVVACTISCLVAFTETL